MRQIFANPLLSDDARIAGLPLVPGSEWLEAMIATSRRFAIPCHGHPSRWDWGVTLKTLALACLKEKQTKLIVSEMSPAERAALWTDTGADVARLRKALRG